MSVTGTSFSATITTSSENVFVLKRPWPTSTSIYDGKGSFSGMTGWAMSILMEGRFDGLSVG